jgi:peroxiredoxin
MTGTQTAVLELGARGPTFSDLLGTDGRRYSLGSFDDKPVLALIFTGNACPTAKAWDEELVRLQSDYRAFGVGLVLVNSNNPYLSPPDRYDEMVKRVEAKGLDMPYLRDENGAVARSYGAVCTPHVFVLDENRRLRYRGRLADSRRPGAAGRHDLREALDDLVHGREVRVPETVPFGCALVW